jgi:hypothetical protein
MKGEIKESFAVLSETEMAVPGLIERLKMSG